MLLLSALYMSRRAQRLQRTSARGQTLSMVVWKRLSGKGCLESCKDRLGEDVNLRELSQFTLTVMEGAVMQSRMFASIEPFDASVRQLRNYLDRLMTLNGHN
ncbi:MAG TPA: hypothetical protein VFC63_18110 [Blastocatellia bacterium]|nr:hypothetical protein [Blastocatellia bacterium]